MTQVGGVFFKGYISEVHRAVFPEVDWTRAERAVPHTPKANIIPTT